MALLARAAVGVEPTLLPQALAALEAFPAAVLAEVGHPSQAGQRQRVVQEGRAS